MSALDDDDSDFVATLDAAAAGARAAEEDELVALAALLGLGDAPQSSLSDDGAVSVPAALQKEDAARGPAAERRRALAALVAAVAEDVIEDSEGALPLVLDATGLPDDVRRVGGPPPPAAGEKISEAEARDLVAALRGALDAEGDAAAVEILRAATKGGGAGTRAGTRDTPSSGDAAEPQPGPATGKRARDA